MAVEAFDVVVNGRRVQAEAGGSLLLAVAVEQAVQHVTLSRGQAVAGGLVREQQAATEVR